MSVITICSESYIYVDVTHEIYSMCVIAAWKTKFIQFWMDYILLY